MSDLVKTNRKEEYKTSLYIKDIVEDLQGDCLSLSDHYKNYCLHRLEEISHCLGHNIIDLRQEIIEVIVND